MKAAAYRAVTRTLSRVLRTPPYLILFLSDSCWMRCNHCWFSEDWKSDNLHGKRLSFDELSKLADSIDRLLFLSLTGGEAFARRDVVEVAELFARKTQLSRYQIPTSGYKPDLIVDRTEAMLRRIPDVPFRVDVSLDGTREIHDQVRRIDGGFDRAVETIRELRKIKERVDHFDLGIITTISTYNEHEVDDIADLVESINPNGEWMVNITRGEVRDQACKDVDPENYFRAHRIIEERSRAGRHGGHSGHATAAWLTAKNASRRKIIKATVDGTRPGGGCAAGSLGGVIYSDGDVKACELLDQSLGNLRDNAFDLAKIWNGRQADDLRNWIQDSRCQCTQECFLSVSMLIQPQVWPDIVLERAKLAGHSRGLVSGTRVDLPKPSGVRSPQPTDHPTTSQPRTVSPEARDAAGRDPHQPSGREVMVQLTTKLGPGSPESVGNRDQ